MRNAIETQRLILRRATEEDLEDYCDRVYREPRVMAMLPGGVALRGEEAIARARATMLDSWQREGFGPWLVLAKQTMEILGHCGLRRWPESEDVEVLYALYPAAWGRGYASEGARVAVDEGFSALGRARIIGAALPRNTGSIRVLEKLGMQFWREQELRGMRLNMYRLARHAWTPV